MTAIVMRGDAGNLQLPDESVDLIVTSPPYFGLRSYTDGGEHYTEQIGAEATPAEYLDALLACTAEWMRVLKPSGSIFVNLGDSYFSGKGAPGKTSSDAKTPARTARRAGGNALDGPSFGVGRKSLIGTPWRYAIRCVDELGLILRSEIIWAKPNGLPESVTDRVRRSHEQVFHFTKAQRYYSAVDHIREQYSPASIARDAYGYIAGPAGGTNGKSNGTLRTSREPGTTNPMGKLPGSVWTIPTAPLRVPAELEVDHFAAYPPELVRRIVLGWSPRDVCTACGEGRRPVVASVGLDMGRPQARRADELAQAAGLHEGHLRALLSVGVSDTGRGAATQTGTGKNTAEVYALADEARAALGGYAREYLLRRPTGFTDACACPDTSAQATPGVVLDPFGGTGTTALVASVLGRVGISNDLSADYCRIARWRTEDPKQRAKVVGTPAKAPKAPPQVEQLPEPEQIPGQLDLLGGAA